MKVVTRIVGSMDRSEVEWPESWPAPCEGHPVRVYSGRMGWS